MSVSSLRTRRVLDTLRSGFAAEDRREEVIAGQNPASEGGPKRRLRRRRRRSDRAAVMLDVSPGLHVGPLHHLVVGVASETAVSDARVSGRMR